METRVQTGYLPDPRAVVQSAMGCISANQHQDPAHQAAAVFVVFAALVERLGIHWMDAAWRGKRILDSGDIAREASALRQYIDEQIRDKGVR